MCCTINAPAAFNSTFSIQRIDLGQGARNYSGPTIAAGVCVFWSEKWEGKMFTITNFSAGNTSKRAAVGLLLAIVAVGALFSLAALAAPPFKPASVAMESGSGTLFALGSVDYDEVEFFYQEVRHVSLTIGYYSEGGPAAADLFAGPVWADGKRSKSLFTTSFSDIGQEDDFDFFETETVEFDANRWKIELISLSSPEKYVRYNYTVTYPKP
jgi:hypothetical protein